jgi:HEAT repeat protein
MNDQEMREMLVEYMGKGFLDNIIALFRQDNSVYPFIADMLGSENIMVRLGTVALVEELVRNHRSELQSAVPGLIALLKHGNPTIRGDAASVLGLMREQSARGALETVMAVDENAFVREAAKDALAEIG